MISSCSNDGSPLLLELVGYDTVKTLKGVLANCLGIEEVNQLDLFTVHPRKRLDEDSLTLSEVGMTPNGVLHLRRLTHEEITLKGGWAQTL